MIFGAWTKKDYPKNKDLCWKKKTKAGWNATKEPQYDGSLKFNMSSKIFNWYQKHPPIESFAREVSREKHLTTS